MTRIFTTLAVILALGITSYASYTLGSQHDVLAHVADARACGIAVGEAKTLASVMQLQTATMDALAVNKPLDVVYKEKRK